MQHSLGGVDAQPGSIRTGFGISYVRTDDFRQKNLELTGLGRGNSTAGHGQDRRVPLSPGDLFKPSVSEQKNQMKFYDKNTHTNLTTSYDFKTRTRRIHR